MSRLLVLLAMVMTTGVAPALADTRNPFFEEWETPFGVAPFDRIETGHFLPAFQRAIDEKRREVEAIAGAEAPPTFENTVEALERSGALLRKVDGVFSNLQNSDTGPELQAIAKEIAPLLAALGDDVVMNPRLFARVRAVWETRHELDLESEQQRLLEETFRDFVQGGALLDADDQRRLREINSELAVLGLQFADNLLADTNDYRLVIEDKTRLAGLPDDVRAAAAEAAAGAGLEGRWLFTLHAPSLWPFLTFADDRELRREMLTAYVSRGAHDGERDNRPLASEMAALRAERAALLGYPTHAHLVLDGNMAGAPEAVYDLLWRLWTPALAVARQEAADLQSAIVADGHEFALEPWDWRYYQEKVRRQRFDLDESAVKPYFALENVRDGAFWLAGKLWGLRFEPRDDVPVYHPEVAAYEVLDRDGSHLGVLLLDYHPRASKRGGAWMNTFRDQWEDQGGEVRPVVVNCGNFSRPAGDAPALLGLDEVRTLFHEFGHALHGLLAQGTYRRLTGTSVPRDFVELPSQLMENWVLEPEVLARYARHWQTGEPIPDELVQRIRDAERFGQGFATVEYLAASFLDLDWHTLVQPVRHEPAAFERQSMVRIGLPDEIVVRYRSPYFAHVFGPGGGYSAGYYSYVWAEVLDADAFAAFRENGILDRETATAYRANILERGHTDDPMELYVAFRGREPKVEALLERKGLGDS